MARSSRLGALLLSFGQMTVDNYRCKSSRYGSGRFLALCDSKYYGDYEHGALYYGLEPGVGDNIRAAKVIFLGSSMVQAAFSTAAVRSYFHKLGVPYFLMGFGYGEVSPFALALLKRWKARPRVLVINADPFFYERPLSQPAVDVLEGGLAFQWRLAQKMIFQRIHRALCFAAPFICPESVPSIFRSTRDGQWDWRGSYIEERALPIDRSTQEPISAQEFEKAKYWGERFLAEIAVDRRCVVLTGTPNSIKDSASIAAALAEALGTSSIFPSAEGMATLDRGHLNFTSAERWSSQFLEALTPVLHDCLQ